MKLLSNEFWGKRSGKSKKIEWNGDPVYLDLMFLQKKWAGSANNSSTPTKRRTSYKNPKLNLIKLPLNTTSLNSNA